jgi:hypothetical protein
MATKRRMNDPDLIQAFYEDIKSQQQEPFKEGSIGWWLNKLPEEYREKAIHNMRTLSPNPDNCCYYSIDDVTDNVNSISDALNEFEWSETPEGHEYWEEIYPSFRDEGYLI